MEKQVKVYVYWDKNEVCLSTDKGMNYYFGHSNNKPSRDTCEFIVSSLVTSLILPTVEVAFDTSVNNEFRFEFKVIDGKES